MEKLNTIKVKVLKAQILRRIDALPLMSQSASKLMKTVADRDHSIHDIIEIVKYDPSLTVKILKLVNSSAYGLSKSITSVERAIPQLGDKLVFGLAMEECAAPVYRDPMEGYEGESGSLWKHSLLTALIARELAKVSVHKVSLEEAYTAGLMHDLGKGILSQYMKGSAPDLLAAVENDKMHDYREAELFYYGTDHCDVGCHIAKHWALPEALCAVIRWHHEPARSPVEYKSLVYVVHLGDIMAMIGGAATGADALMYGQDAGCDEFFSADEGWVDRAMNAALQEYQKIIAAMSNE
ncbi:MAG: HDOD domain-containing protein [Desulfobulbaceae bacterium]|nr:HDOD domain-containing protein [Desulfobulbaceae bacterium]